MADVEATSNGPEILPAKSPQITPAELKLLLRYDPETGDLFWRERPMSTFAARNVWLTWNTRYANKPALASINANGYKTGHIHKGAYIAHRAIWAMVHGEWPANQIDHINGDRTDNRLINLRAVSNAENSRNQKRQSRNKSGISGVSFHIIRQKYQAYITLDGKKQYLGLYETIETAAEARKRAEIQCGFHVNHGR